MKANVFSQTIRTTKILAVRFGGWRTSVLIWMLVLAALAAACSGPTASTQEANSTATVQQNSASTEQAAVFGTEEFGLSKQELVEHIEAVESFIAKCMSEAGFEYLAVDYDTVRRGMNADKRLPGVSDEQFMAQYGFGISTLYTGLAPQTSALNTAAKIGLGEQNIEIFNRLSPADQVAYTRTLFGQNPDATFAVSLELEDFSRTGGCTRKAVEQTFSEDQIKATYLNPLDARIEQDPRMLAAVAEFAECVRKEGFNYNHPDEVEKDIKNRLDTITAGAPVDSLSAEAKAALSELQGEERAVAQIVVDCAEEFVEPVKIKLEQEFSK